MTSQDSAAPAPLISVVIPVYNRRERIVAALRSVGAGDPALCEIVVVDDGSTDGTPEAVAQAAQDLGLGGLLRLERQANAGPGAARNRGAGLARGRWLAFLDSDDVWFPWTLPLLAQVLRDDPEPALLLMRIVDELPDDLATPRGPETLVVDRYRHFLHAFRCIGNTPKAIQTGAGNCVVDRELFLRLGGFNPALWHGEDVELFLRTVPENCRLIDQPPMVRYDRHSGDNLTYRINNLVSSLSHVYKNHYLNRNIKYGKDSDLMSEYFAGMVFYGVPLAFAQGWPLTAWRLLLTHLRPLLGPRPRRWRFVAVLFATPVMALRKPGRYRFRPWPGARDWGARKAQPLSESVARR